MATAQERHIPPPKFYRPQQFTPPVHARPLRDAQQYQDAQAVYRQVQQRDRRETQNRQNHRYGVRQTSRQQVVGQPQASAIDRFGRPLANTDDQWRTRSEQAVQQTTDSLRSLVDDPAPQLQHSLPSSSTQWDQGSHQENRYGTTNQVQTELPALTEDRNKPPTHQANMPVRQGRHQESRYGNTNQVQTELPALTEDLNTQTQTPTYQADIPVRQGNQTEQFGTDQFTLPAIETTPPAPAASSYGQTSTLPTGDTALPNTPATNPFVPEQDTQSVLTTEQTHPLRHEPSAPSRQQVTDGNSLRGLRIQPRRLRDSNPNYRNTRQSNYRSGGQRRYYQDEGSSARDDEEGSSARDDEGSGARDDEFDDEDDQVTEQLNCQDFRDDLLNRPITEIVLDIAPRRPVTESDISSFELTRNWTDCSGNSLGSGTLTGLERSYILITNELGQSQRVRLGDLSDNDLAVVSEYWGLPLECGLGCQPYTGRNWTSNAFFWKASALCHKPLYFENIQLERYGHSSGPFVEPLRSSAHFFASLLLGPYNTAIHPPNECQYALGLYRPGDCAPWLREPFPISLRGAIRQGAVIGTGIAVFP